MKIDKKKYSAEEVKSLVEEEISKYKNEIDRQREIAKELSDKNKKIGLELEQIRKKESYINTALVKAEREAEGLKNKSFMQYELAMEKLRKFSIRWANYFDALKEKYPMYPFITESRELAKKVDELFKTDRPNEIIEKLDKAVSEKTKKSDPFNPKQKIEEYLAGTSENGFNLQEVLNPGKLELEDICKELGLTEE